MLEKMLENVLLGIVGGMGAGIVIGSTILPYYYKKQYLINTTIKRGKEYVLKQIEEEEKEYKPIIDKFFDFGEYIAIRKYKQGKFDKIIEKYAKKAIA
ncbi:MAG: hypothetical protein QW199_01410 [Candidatus Pacearchaeota archaeon]